MRENMRITCFRVDVEPRIRSHQLKIPFRLYRNSPAHIKFPPSFWADRGKHSPSPLRQAQGRLQPPYLVRGMLSHTTGEGIVRIAVCGYGRTYVLCCQVGVGEQPDDMACPITRHSNRNAAPPLSFRAWRSGERNPKPSSSNNRPLVGQTLPRRHNTLDSSLRSE